MNLRLTETAPKTTFRRLAEGQSRVDRENNILRGVKLLGYESKNDGGKRRYKRPAASLYENVPVNINHPGFLDDVKTESRWGVTLPGTVTVEADGVFADVEYNPHKAVTEEILWWAEKHPDQLGMSHVAYGTQEESDGLIWLTVVEVESVDLVARPATTKGFFEAHTPKENTMDFEKMFKEAQAEIATLKQEHATALKQEQDKVAVAEQALAEEKAAHESTKREHERDSLLKDAGMQECAESFRKAVYAAESVEDAKALIEMVEAKRQKPKSVSSEEARESVEGDEEGDEPKSYESLKESGAFAYGRV